MKYTIILSFFAGILHAVIFKESAIDSQETFARLAVVLAPFGIIGQALDSLKKRG